MTQIKKGNYIITIARVDGTIYIRSTGSVPKDIKQIRKIPERVKNTDWFTPINPADLTEAEMRELGFAKWAAEDSMYLIPLWLFPFLTDEVGCGCISGEKRIYKKSEMDNDTRFGCLAYGVMPKKEA